MPFFLLAFISNVFEVELRGRLGIEEGDAKEMKVLNRILRITGRRLAYEAE